MLLKKIFDFFVDVMFPWFFTFLHVLHCCLHIWSSSHLHHLLVTDFRRKMPSVSPTRDPKAHSDLLWICLLHISYSLVAEFLSLYAFSPSCQARLDADSFPFAFTRAVLNAQLCGLSQACRPWLAFCMYSLAIYNSLLSLPSRAYRWARHGVGAMWVRPMEH